MPKRPPHCASAYHYQHCICDHERQYHQGEEGVCLERNCGCSHFRLASGYPEIKHENLR